MEDLYTEQRKAMLEQMSRDVDANRFDQFAQARKMEIERLGKRYILHPSNRVQRRAKPYGSVR